MKKSFFDRYNSDKRFCLIYTLKCNIECLHCILNCSPRRSEKFDLETAKKIIKINSSNGKKMVVLSGGEIFLFYNELIELVKYSNSSNLEVDIETNGFWGTSYYKAYNTLSELKKNGVSVLNLSVDMYHQKNIPISFQINIIKAAKKLNIPIEVNILNSSNEDKDGDLINEISQVTDNYFVQPVLNLGRANQFKDIESYSLADISVCDSLMLTFLPDGSVFVCCDIEDKNDNLLNTPVYLGNSFNTSIPKIVNSKNHQIIKGFYDPESPCFFKKISDDKYNNKKFSNICHVCKVLLNDENILNKLKHFF
jgi:organic radical activating enzyme